MTAEKIYSVNSLQYRAYRYWLKYSGAVEPKQLTFCYLFWVTFLFAPMAWLFNHVIRIRIPFTKVQIKIVPISVLILIPLVLMFGLGLWIVSTRESTSAAILPLIILGCMITGPLTVHTVLDMTPGDHHDVADAFGSAALVLFSPVLMPMMHVLYFFGFISMKMRHEQLEDGYGYANVLKQWIAEDVKIGKWEMPRIVPIFVVVVVIIIIASPSAFFSALSNGLLMFVVFFGSVFGANFLIVHVFRPVKNKLQGIKEKKQQSLGGMLIMGLDSAHRKVCPIVALEEEESEVEE